MRHKNECSLTDSEQGFTDKYREAMRTDDDRLAEWKRPVDYSFLDSAPKKIPGSIMILISSDVSVEEMRSIAEQLQP